MATLDDVLANYNRLCDYCDRFFNRVLSSHRRNMKCEQGCYSCCTLKTVSAIEGEVIRRFLEKNTPGQPPGDPFCVFLNRGSCSIYPVRPVICRTHGLILNNTLDQTVFCSCELNFTGARWQEMPEEDLLDSVMITENLQRLNMAYCMLSGIDYIEQPRIELNKLIRISG